MSGNTSAGATADDWDSTLLFSPFDLHRPFYTPRPFAPLLGHRFATRCRSGDTHRHYPASQTLEIHFANLHRLLLVGSTLPELPGNIVDEKMMFVETSRASEPTITGLSQRRWNQIQT